MNRIVITGCNGLLGQSLILSAPTGFEIHGIGSEPTAILRNRIQSYSQGDITQTSALASVLGGIGPDCIINAAAITDVDLCEREPDLCARVNRDAVIAMAQLGYPLVQVSTDYVFDGVSGPYVESDPVAPLSVYGKTKWESEVAVLAANPKNLAVRTLLLWGRIQGGKTSFPDFIRNHLSAGKRVRIVTDQVGNPTLAEDLALGIWALVQNQSHGVYHIAGSDRVSRLEWTEMVADFYGLDKSLIDTCLTSDLGQLAKRPLNSGLVCDKLTEETGFRPRGIREQLMALGDNFS
jgi:dTDP-4-dehydrorhamnose reductase